MKNILVPIDFSTASRNATLYAVSLAQVFNAKVILINVVEPPMVADDSILASVLITQAEILAENSKLISQEIESISKNYPVRMGGLAREGFLKETIINLAAEISADMIVMGMKGKGESHSLFGSSVTKIVRQLRFPVLVIPSKAGFYPIKTIAVASDFDPDTENKQYRLLNTLANAFHSSFNIVNVSVKGRELKQSQVIGKMKANMAFSEFGTEFHTIREDSVEEGLEDFIEDYDPDLFVMIAREHSFIDKLFGKVHTKKMSYKTRKPLLILPENK